MSYNERNWLSDDDELPRYLQQLLDLEKNSTKWAVEGRLYTRLLTI